MDTRTSGKVIGCSVRLTEQNFNSARVANMTVYTTQDLPRDGAFSEVVLG